MTPPFDPSTTNSSGQNSDARGPVDPKGAVPPPPPPRAPAYYVPPPPPPRRGGLVARVVGGLVGTFLITSIFLNLYLGVMLYTRLSRPTETVYLKGETQHRIVILPVDELIDSETASFMRDSLHHLKVNPPAALVLRVDSPGGTVGASDRIHDLIGRFKTSTNGQVPIVASFGPVAASGGYYVAADADHIVAEPGCITGSIGVMRIGFTFKGLMDKIGVTPEIMTATGGERKELANNAFRDWTDEDRALTRKILDHHYQRFKDIVQNGRGQKLTPGLEIVANGDVFTTSEAISHGLVDSEGYLNEAIDQAKQLAKIPVQVETQVTVMRPAKTFGLFAVPGYHRSTLDQGITSQHVRAWLAELTVPRFEYRLNSSLMGSGP